VKRGRKAPPAAMRGSRMPKEKLAQAIEPIAEDYVAFVSSHPEGEAPGDSKAFAARHNAGLTALHHLTELTAMVSDDASAEAVQESVDQVLADTRERMAQEEEDGGTSR
jgi:hypothetical protein